MRLHAWLIVVFFFVSTAQAADTFPSKPIRMLVPFPAGGGIDVVGRILADQIAEQTGQQVVVDNRAGASGNIAGTVVADANPDGYTLLFALDTLITANPYLFAKIGYDPVKQLAPISRVGISQLVILVNPAIAAQSVSQLIMLAKEKPGQLNIGSAGIGTAAHLAGELFVRTAGLRMVHVPYKGSPQAITDLVSGQIQVTTPTVPAAMAMIRSNRVRALAVTGSKRSPALPEIPTVAEAGLPGYEVEFWVALLAPAKTASSIVAHLAEQTGRALDIPAVRTHLLKQGMDAAASSPQVLADLIARDSKKWGKLIKDANIKISE